MHIASQAAIGAYDCLYVALADHEGCEPVTADARRINGLQATYDVIIAPASVP